MSVERFYECYPPDESLPAIVEHDQNMARIYTRPLRFLAGRLIQLGADGVRAIDKQKVDGEELDMTPESGAEIFDASKDQSAAVVFGASVTCLMDASETGYVDLDRLISIVNNSSTGTLIPKFVLPSHILPQAVMSTEEKGRMQEAISKDPTLSIFFKEPKEMPNSMRTYLDDIGFLSFIQQTDLIDEWGKRAKFLLETDWESNNGGDEKVPFSTALATQPLWESQIRDILNDREF